MPADSLKAQTLKLIDSRTWNCDFIRARAVLSSRAVECLEQSGNLIGAQICVDAVIADVLLDLRIGQDRHLEMPTRPHQPVFAPSSAD